MVNALHRLSQRRTGEIRQTAGKFAGEDLGDAAGQRVLATGICNSSASTTTLPNPSLSELKTSIRAPLIHGKGFSESL